MDDNVQYYMLRHSQRKIDKMGEELDPCKWFEYDSFGEYCNVKFVHGMKKCPKNKKICYKEMFKEIFDIVDKRF